MGKPAWPAALGYRIWITSHPSFPRRREPKLLRNDGKGPFIVTYHYLGALPSRVKPIQPLRGLCRMPTLHGNPPSLPKRLCPKPASTFARLRLPLGFFAPLRFAQNDRTEGLRSEYSAGKCIHHYDCRSLTPRRSAVATLRCPVGYWLRCWYHRPAKGTVYYWPGITNLEPKSAGNKEAAIIWLVPTSPRD